MSDEVSQDEGARGGATDDTNNGQHNNGNEQSHKPNSKNTRARNKKPRPKSTFKGEEVEMNGHVYQTYKESEDKRQFTKTTEALARYINKNTKYLGDLECIYNDFKMPEL